jgi:hypothetical protein
MTKNEALRMGMDALVSVLANHKGAPVVPWNDALDAMEIALEVKDEPVAWLHRFIEGGISIGLKPSDLERHPERWEPLYTEPKPCPTCEALARTVMLDQTAHDTPPQRTWVGLTDEEIKAFDTWHDNREEEVGWVNPSEIVAYIEAKLKEKNS